MSEPHLGLMPQATMVARLRAATATAHREIEAAPAMVRLLAGDLTEAEYLAVLCQTGAFRLALEARLRALLARVSRSELVAARAFLDGARLRALVADLDWFGIGLPPAAPAEALPALATGAQALGALYVLEGSDLGGRVIARHLSATLGLGAQTGGGFYGGHEAEATRQRWRRFCDLLRDAAGAGEATAAELVDGAVATFRGLDAWLRRIPGAVVADSVVADAVVADAVVAGSVVAWPAVAA